MSAKTRYAAADCGPWLNSGNFLEGASLSLKISHHHNYLNLSIELSRFLSNAHPSLGSTGLDPGMLRMLGIIDHLSSLPPCIAALRDKQSTAWGAILHFLEGVLTSRIWRRTPPPPRFPLTYEQQCTSKQEFIHSLDTVACQLPPGIPA